MKLTGVEEVYEVGGLTVRLEHVGGEFSSMLIREPVTGDRLRLTPEAVRALLKGLRHALPEEEL